MTRSREDKCRQICHLPKQYMFIYLYMVQRVKKCVKPIMKKEQNINENHQRNERNEKSQHRLWSVLKHIEILIACFGTIF